MSNRLTKGEALVGAVKTDADMNIGDDAYITGAFGKGVTVTTEADGASMAISAAELLGGIIVATPTEARTFRLQQQRLLSRLLMQEQIQVLVLSSQSLTLRLTHTL